MNKSKIRLAEAQALASYLLGALSPGCDRLAIAGSVRRRASTVGDVELCAIPTTSLAPVQQATLLDDDAMGERPAAFVSELDLVLDRLVAEKRNFAHGDKNGEKQKTFVVYGKRGRSIKVELWITTPPQWGLIYMIRTGPQSFSRRLMTPRPLGGLLPDGYQVRDGFLWYNGDKVATPDERALFDILELDYIEPEDRR